jgi:hypothetical protein
MLCGRRCRFWIVGVPFGWVVENVVDRDVAAFPAGIVAVLL